MVKGFQIIAALVGAFGGFTTGLVIGWNSPAQSKYSAQLNIPKESSKSDWIGSIITVGAAISGIPLPLFLDTIGRRITMQIMALLCTGFYILLAFANSFVMYLVGRACLGFSAAAFCVCSPVYAAEVVETSIRGALGVCFQLLLVIGIFVSFAVGPYVSLQMFNLVSAAIIGAHFALMFFIPESPLFLVKKGKSDEKIRKTLQFLRGKDYDVDNELNQIKKDVAEAEERSKGGVWVKMKQKPAPKALSIGIMLAIFQQFSGINAIMFFASKIFEQSGNKEYSDTFALIIAGVQVFATLLAAAVVDRFGRRPLLIISYTTMAVCLGSMAIYFFCVNLDEPLSMMVASIPLICISVYIVGFALGSGPLTWSMLGEMFSMEVKGIACSICSCINWLCAFIVAQSFTPIMGTIGGGFTYAMFAIFCVVSVFCIYTFTIETKGKEIEQIQKELGKE